MKWAISGLIVIVLYLGSLFLSGQVFASDSYSLPYPGLLPDSPVYFLKVARDQIMLFFIRDDRDKAFYLLLMSDKRLAAGEMLVNRGEKTAGATSVLRGEDYFAQAVDKGIAARNSKKDVSDLFSKLMVSVAKHTEVLGNLGNKVAGDDAATFTKARRENQNSDNRVREIFLQISGVTK